jgi:hypothetical protein
VHHPVFFFFFSSREEAGKRRGTALCKGKEGDIRDQVGPASLGHSKIRVVVGLAERSDYVSESLEEYISQEHRWRF